MFRFQCHSVEIRFLNVDCTSAKHFIFPADMWETMKMNLKVENPSKRYVLRFWWVKYSLSKCIKLFSFFFFFLRQKSNRKLLSPDNILSSQLISFHFMLPNSSELNHWMPIRSTVTIAATVAFNLIANEQHQQAATFTKFHSWHNVMCQFAMGATQGFILLLSISDVWHTVMWRTIFYRFHCKSMNFVLFFNKTA